MLPALPEANVLPEIWPPLAMLNDPVVITADPALPEPRVPTEMIPSFEIDKDPALTRTVPAAPLLPRLAWEKMPVRKAAEVPSIDTAPGTLSETLPALPRPVVRLAISPLGRIVRLSATTDTLAAVAGPWVRDSMAVSEFGLALPSTT